MKIKNSVMANNIKQFFKTGYDSLPWNHPEYTKEVCHITLPHTIVVFFLILFSMYSAAHTLLVPMAIGITAMLIYSFWALAIIIPKHNDVFLKYFKVK